MFTAIYQKLFRLSLTEGEPVFEWALVFDSLKLGDGLELPDISDLDFSFASVLEKEDKFKALLNKYLQDWGRTYDIVKAILLTYLQELAELKESNKIEVLAQDLVGSYVRLAQDYIGGENTSLVHAVASNILENDLAEI